MLSIEKCKEILEKNGIKYTIEQVKKIRQILCVFAEIEYLKYQERNEKSRNLYEGVH